MSDEVKHTCIQALVAVARHHGIDLSVDDIIHEEALKTEPSARRLARIASSLGLKAKSLRLNWERLHSLGQAFPVIARLENGNGVVLIGFKGGRVIVFDPLAETAVPLLLDRETFEAQWGGDVVLVKRRYKRTDEDRPFGLRWFLPEIWRQRKAFRDVIIAALALNVIALVIPIFFQIVVDKVLVHNTISTLKVLFAGVILAIIFEALLTYARQLSLMHAVRKIDIRIAGKTFRHLLRLPTAFFNRASAGVLTKHMQQAEQIREFMTGQALVTFLDLSVLFVFLPVLLFYSVELTFVVLAFTGLIALIIGLLIGPFRRRLHDLYQIEGERQAHLVESIHGADTVKALALEPTQREMWESLASRTVEQTFSVGKIALSARTLSHLFEQLMSVSIIGFGVFLVISKKITVGELIAFQMLANRVSSPLVQLISLIHEYQETGLAIRMLGKVMNAKPERDSKARKLRPELRGAIEFDEVFFSYPEAPAPAINGLSITIPWGSTVGVVGKSGSGKTTFSRLLQAMYPVQSGAIRIGGYDIREIGLSYLRSNIGVVLQDSFLFRGTIRDNIARTKPDATIEEIVEAARMAGAHEFIRDFPLKYDTELEEGAVNLSGGQRQRLAIARALLRDPPILIFDEATSSLDPESEYVIRKNLSTIAKGRTLILISHRLSMVRNADMIIVMDKGKLNAVGRHGKLMEKCEIYRKLWTIQNDDA